METVDPVAGIILSDSLSAAKAVAECRVRDRRRSRVPRPTRWRRRRIALPLHSSRAVVLVSLDGEACPTATGSRLVASSSAGATSRRPGRRPMVLTRGRFVVPSGGHFSAAANFVLHGGHV